MTYSSFLREHRVKTDIVWNANGTVTYKNNRWYVFVPEMSNGSEYDNITSVNLPFVVSCGSPEVSGKWLLCHLGKAFDSVILLIELWLLVFIVAVTLVQSFL